MNEAHRRFREWLTGGAEGDPPRDIAVHASVCAECSSSIAALDLLSVVDTGKASMPAEPVGREHSRLVVGVRLAGATAVLFSAAILGVGVSQLIGVSHPNGPVAQASPTPDQNVLGATATPQPSQPSAAPTPQDTLTPLGTPFPTQTQPGATAFATPFPYWTYIPTPYPTPFATPTGQPTPGPTDTPPPPTATPTPPTPTPDPTATPPTDTVGDGVSDAVENQYGSNPNDPVSTPEALLYSASTCGDSVDNDLDGSTDAADSGCL